MSTGQQRGGTRVVVGIDGSAPSKAALRWATRYAALMSGVVEAVTAWDYPASYEWAPVIDGEGFRDAAATKLEEVVREVTGDHSPANVERVVEQGHPAQVLLDQSRGADPLVVGKRGLGAFTSALMRSDATVALAGRTPFTAAHVGRRTRRDSARTAVADGVRATRARRRSLTWRRGRLPSPCSSAR